MEDDTCELFNTEALSFDSTLDSLMDVDYITDDSALPFDPSSISPPSDILMSAHNSFRADIGSNDGDLGNPAESNLEEEEEKSVSGKKVSVVDSEGCEKKTSEKVNDLTVHIDIEIKERVANDTREPSPNFDQIKAKRKKNLAKQKPAVKRTAVNNCSPKSAKSTLDRQSKSDLKSDKSDERVKEPPLKKLKASNEANQNESAETGLGKKCNFVPCSIAKETASNTKQVSDTCKSRGAADKVNIPKEIALQSKTDVQSCIAATSAKTVGMTVITETVPNKNGDIGKDLENQPNKDTHNSKDKSNKTAVLKEGSELSTNTDKTEEQITSQELNLQKVTCTSEEISNMDENKTIDNETEEKREDNHINEIVNGTEDDIDESGGTDTELKVEEEEEYDDDDIEEDVDDDEIHNWLEEGLTKEEIREKTKVDLKDGEFLCSEKFVLEDKGASPFEMLPVGWVMITHNSGMPVYLHKESRVCTFARPYYIGSGSSRKHDVPLNSVPCLQYRHEIVKENTQQLEAEETSKQTESKEKSQTEAVNNAATNGIDVTQNATDAPVKELLVPKPIVQYADDTSSVVNIEPEELNKYCRGLFSFRTVTVKKFKTWREKRAHMLAEKKKEDKAVPRMVPDTKLITCPIPPEFTSKKSKKKEFVLNPEGKTAVSILHEYTQNVLRVQPTYEFKEIANAELPFQATVLINGMQYGSGIATGKRQAKNEGARATLEIFMPELAELWNEKSGVVRQKDELKSDLKFFEDIAIEDPRVPELCVKSSLPQPYQMLHTCLQRNYGLGDTTFKVDRKMISNQKTEFTLTVGKRTCTVVCKNKREAKQQAAQKMLQELHPFLKNWAAIIRLYSRSAEVGFSERKEEFAIQEVHHEKMKNKEILASLKDAMRKVKEHRRIIAASSSTSIPIPTPATLDL